MINHDDYKYMGEGPDAEKWQEWLKFAHDLEKKYNLMTYGEYFGKKTYVDYWYADGIVYWDIQWHCPPNAASEINTFFSRKFRSN
ncbi:hypothetical protein [Pseudocnuella soli]|uniref:hypothetical protein n=1 Tax=Pseudocnuella soli TaxID=2502779 RepID=UPI001053875E|nr:hypothetical protein [Pseudocnuella soli]